MDNKPITGGQFIRLVHFLTTQPDAPPLPTGKPGIHRHVVQIPGTLKPVHVLRRDQDGGSLADLRVAESGSEADVRRLASTMHRQAGSRAAVRAGVLARLDETASSSAAAENAAPQRTPYQRVWRSRRQELRALHTEYLEKSHREHKLTGADFVRLVQQRAEESGVREPTGVEGIDRCLVPMPELGRDIQLLMHRDPGGELTDLHLLPSIEEEPHLLDKMEIFQNRRPSNSSSTSSQQVRSTQDQRDSNHLLTLWEHLGPPLEAPFQAYVQRRHAQHESHAGIIPFVRHLNELCNTAGGAVVDAEHGITRHVLVLEGSDKPVTLLRRVDDEGRPTLRHVGRGPMDEVMTIRNIVGRMQAGKPNAQRSARAEPRPAAPPHAAAMPASPAGTRAARIQRADQLTRALEAMVANKAAGKRNLLEGADQASGMAGPTLRSWFTHDGRLNRSFDALTALNGFFEERNAIYQHLSELGHEDQADRLPQPLTAELLAAVLKARVDHPTATNGASLARLTRGNRRVIDRTIDPRTGALKIADFRIQHLPGYDAHWQTIRASLRALGFVAKAHNLPRPPTPGQQFLRAVREDLYPMAAAAYAMWLEPGLPVREAAARMSDSTELAERLEVLVGPGGQVRSRAEIEARLPHLQLHRLRELDALLAQLKPTATSRMSRVLVPGFGNFGAKLFVVNESGDNAGVRSTTKKNLPSIYADSPDLVMPPRSFKHDRARQALRWLSTVLKKEFKTIEVQCYFDAKRGDVWVSSNNEGVNRKIRGFLSDGGLVRKLAQEDIDAGASREGRHQAKLARKLAAPAAGGPMAPLLQAMSQGRFRVPTDTVYQNGKAIDLHAERRIKDAFKETTGEPLNLRSLAGTMRPCTVCAEDLSLPATARRGPAWLSRAAQAFHDANEIVERNIKESIGTYASLMKNDKLSVHYDTDSGSDDDDAAAGTAGHASGPGPSQPRDEATPLRSRSSTTLRPGSSAPSASSAVLGKRNAEGLRIREPQASPEHPEPAQAAAFADGDIWNELDRHLEASSWPASPPATTWRPASPPMPASPTPEPPAEEAAPGTTPHRTSATKRPA